MFRILFLILSLLLVSCSESLIVQTPTEPAALSKDVYPQAMMCGYKYYTTVQTDHYEPTSNGKYIGFWGPHNPYLRTHYGYLGTTVSGVNEEALIQSIQNAVTAGFSYNNMLISIKGISNWQDIVNNYFPLAFYIDEPLEHECMSNPPIDLSNYYSYIHENTNSKLIISGYKRCDHLITSPYYDVAMYSAYRNWYVSELPCFSETTAAYLEGEADQRPAWTHMKNLLSNRFSMTWISKDDGPMEYGSLFGHANNLGINSVWVYFHGPLPDETLEAISSAAWVSGFLRRWVKDVRVEQKCVTHADKGISPCPCSIINQDCRWEIVRIIPISLPYEVWVQ